MPRYGRDYDRSFGRGPSLDAWRRGPERSREGRRRYDEELYRRYAHQARGSSMQNQHAGGWIGGYDRDHSRVPRMGGLYGASMYGGGRYGGDYMGAWAPGGWSAEHGREHVGLRNPERYGRDFLRARRAQPHWGEAPTS